jgi:chromosome segregation ATPase
MHVAGETERRINQLYNDVHAIYDQLDSVEKVQKSHTEQLTTLNTTVAGIWTTQQQHGDKLNSLDAAFAVMSEQLREMRATQIGHEERFTGIDQQLEKVDQRFQQVDQRFEQVDQRFEQIDQRFEQVDQRFEQIDQRFEQVDQRFDAQDEKLSDLRDQLNGRLDGQDMKLDMIMKALGISAN